MDDYDEFVLARVIAASLDGGYDDGNGVFTGARVMNGFQVAVDVSDGDDDSPARHFIVTVAVESTDE
jgi:hypothetical protein